jgi:hypothetical protein
MLSGACAGVWIFVSHVAANSVLQRLGSNLSGFVTRNFQYSGFFLASCSTAQFIQKMSDRCDLSDFSVLFSFPHSNKKHVTLPASVN